MKILISAHTIEGFGLGNIYRMLYLYDYLKNQNFSCVHFESSNPIAYILAKENNIQIVNPSESKYDFTIYDSPYNFNYSVQIPQEIYNSIVNLRNKTKVFIAFDYCRFQENWCDIAINLYNHNSNSISLFKGKIFSGIEYSILKPEILRAKKTPLPLKNKILISIGGEDSHGKTLEIISKLSNYINFISIVVGAANKNKSKIIDLGINESQIFENVKNMGELIQSHDVIICNGGTTLLEALYLEKQIIPIAQSQFEQDFISHLPIKFVTFDDLPVFLHKNFPKPLQFVDGKGKERILQILLNHE